MEESVQEGVDPSLQLESAEVEVEVEHPGTLHLTPDPPAWPGHGWQAPEPQPVNTGLSGGGESSRGDVTAQLQNALLVATIGVTIFFALVLVIILAKLYQTFESPLAPASTVESQLSYLTSSVGNGMSGQQEQDRGRNRVGEGSPQVLEAGGVSNMTGIGRVSPILEEEHSLSAIGMEEDEDGGTETKY